MTPREEVLQTIFFKVRIKKLKMIIYQIEEKSDQRSLNKY